MEAPDYKLYPGDCLEIMPTLETGSIDALIADWPYGTTACPWDSVIPLDRLWPECKRVIKRNGAIVLTARQPFTSVLVMTNLDQFKYTWVWEKTMPTNFVNANNKPLTGFEDIVVFSAGTTANGSDNLMTYNPQMVKGKPYRKVQKHDRRVGAWDAGTRTPFLGVTVNDGQRYPNGIIRASNNNHDSLHPTQKPLALMEYLIRTYTNPGDLILDNTMGSGTTGEACLRTGRRFIGIEKDPGYFKVAEQRLADVARELRGEWKPLKGNDTTLDDLPLFGA